MGTAPMPPGKAMYVAPRPDWDWLRSEQRKLYARSEQDVDYVFPKLWGLVTDPRNLRMALARVAGNRGRRTADMDGITGRTRVGPYRLAWVCPPLFAIHHGEPGA
jgi:retron-type reverse transcriptase